MLEIKTTGFTDFLDESANIKELIIGGPGVGKTRSSSFWPKPFYLACEPGLGSVADRGVPYADITSSKDMLDALSYLKALEKRKKPDRQYQTVVLDTIDSFQRKVKDEWLLQTKAGTFTGYDAWGFLDSKMQMTLVRLLNLDYHVIVLAHYKDKTRKNNDGEEFTELVLQMQGDTKDTIFNDFDLVGFMDTYWAPEDGQRVEKRGVTFTRTPDRPFLKDRYNVMPQWLPITFAESDYEQQRECFLQSADIDQIPEAAVIGEIPDAVEESKAVKPMAGGPVEPQDPRDIPLDQYTKPDLAKLGKELGLTFKGNTLKGEMVTAILEAQAKAPAVDPEPTDDQTPVEPAPPVEPEPAAAPPEVTPETVDQVQTGEATGVPMTEAEVGEALGGTVVEVIEDPAAAVSAEQAALAARKEDAAKARSVCADCGNDLSAEPNKDMVRLSYVKHRRYLCNTCMVTANQKVGKK